jgi:uncharacterized protein (DUF885 family)
MTFMKKTGEEADRTDGQNQIALDADGLPVIDAQLAAALRDFKSSVHAFSDAAYTRPRTMTKEVRQRSWRVAAGWAMGCLLLVGSLSGGLIDHQHRLETARAAAIQRAADQAEQQRLAVLEQSAKQDEEDLLAEVDSAVSRQVPSALDPLAQMMEDETK